MNDLLIPVFGIGLVAMTELGFTPRRSPLSALPREIRRAARVGVAFGWRQPRVRLLFALSLVQYGFLTWAFHAWPPYFLDLLGEDAPWVTGVVSALVAASTIAGNSLVAFFSRFCGHRTTLLLGAAGVAAAGAGIGAAGSFWAALPFLALMAGAMGVTGPVKQAFLHQLVDSEQRATLVSFDAMAGDAGSVGGQLGLGLLARGASLGSGFLVGGLISVLALPVVVVLRRLGGEADVIVGTGGGVRGACAALGLPTLSSVDTGPRLAAVRPGE